MSQMNNMDMNMLMNMISKMDKKQLEQGLSKINDVLSSDEKQKILSELQKNMKK